MSKDMKSIDLPHSKNKTLFQVRVDKALLDRVKEIKSEKGLQWTEIIEACFARIVKDHRQTK